MVRQAFQQLKPFNRLRHRKQCQIARMVMIATKDAKGSRPPSKTGTPSQSLKGRRLSNILPSHSILKVSTCSEFFVATGGHAYVELSLNCSVTMKCSWYRIQIPFGYKVHLGSQISFSSPRGHPCMPSLLSLLMFGDLNLYRSVENLERKQFQSGFCILYCVNDDVLRHELYIW